MGSYLLNTNPFVIVDFRQLSIPPIGRILNHAGYIADFRQLSISSSSQISNHVGYKVIAKH